MFFTFFLKDTFFLFFLKKPVFLQALQALCVLSPPHANSPRHPLCLCDSIAFNQPLLHVPGVGYFRRSPPFHGHFDGYLTNAGHTTYCGDLGRPKKLSWRPCAKRGHPIHGPLPGGGLIWGGVSGQKLFAPSLSPALSNFDHGGKWLSAKEKTLPQLKKLSIEKIRKNFRKISR